MLIPRGKRIWLARVPLGRDPKTGKPLFHNKTIHGKKKDAQQYLNGVLREHELGIFAGTMETTVNTLLDGLLRDYKVNGKRLDWAELVARVHLRPFFGAMKAARLGTDQIQNYITHRRQATIRALANGKKRIIAPAKNATINNELALLRRALNLGKQASPPKVPHVPFIPILDENNVRKGFFEHEHFIAVRRALPQEIQPVITFGFYTGCRRGEILHLQWPQVDLSERVVRLEPGETKNDEARMIPLAPELYEMLVMQKEIRDSHFPECPWVFFRLGKRIRDFRHAWERACKAAGLVTTVADKDKPTRLFHDLRRTGVRNLVRAGVPERVAMAISGHKTRAIFDRYNIVSETDIKDAARKLGEYFAPKSTIPVEGHTNGTHEPRARVN